MQSGRPACRQGRVSKLQRDILKTLAYADIFNYPLTVREIWEYLISRTEVKSSVILKALLIFADCGRIYTDRGFYFLKGRDEIVELRKKREEWSKKKWEIARKTVDKLKIIPTVKMIGVTGALAMENCKDDDDIDLLIITSKNNLWLTRLLILLVSFLAGIKRRKPEDKNIKDKICFNLFLDEDHLTIKPINLFLAHEVCQVKPIYDKGGVYEKFIQENEWVSSFLPNAFNSSKFKVQSSKSQFKIQSLFFAIIKIFNNVTYLLQLWYMKPKMTCEKVSLHQAFFHPNNLREKIMKEYNRKLMTLGLDKNEDSF